MATIKLLDFVGTVSGFKTNVSEHKRKVAKATGEWFATYVFFNSFFKARPLVLTILIILY